MGWGTWNRPLFWKEMLLLCPGLKCSWIAKITFLVFSKISFVNQTTEDIFRSMDGSLKSSLLFAWWNTWCRSVICGCKASILICLVTPVSTLDSQSPFNNICLSYTCFLGRNAALLKFQISFSRRESSDLPVVPKINSKRNDRSLVSSLLSVLHKSLHLLNYQLPTPPSHDSKVITSFHVARGLCSGNTRAHSLSEKSSMDAGMGTSRVCRESSLDGKADY